jgi:hypothetical protein
MQDVVVMIASQPNGLPSGSVSDIADNILLFQFIRLRSKFYRWAPPGAQANGPGMPWPGPLPQHDWERSDAPSGAGGVNRPAPFELRALVLAAAGR